MLKTILLIAAALLILGLAVWFWGEYRFGAVNNTEILPPTPPRPQIDYGSHNPYEAGWT